ncbi:hypothetical protein BT63DRAFT_244888 [Microthyrium microscopicum]|uniref:Uncharacterized protein n=1 Tax=Microthyrium microscopicum TaxID=703497 RepID=A0A6A6UEH1_9PEZI|nr:hypothetical protein BT63DRAFT_244888 [Microthyrium microscopicum]
MLPPNQKTAPQDRKPNSGCLSKMGASFNSGANKTRVISKGKFLSIVDNGSKPSRLPLIRRGPPRRGPWPVMTMVDIQHRVVSATVAKMLIPLRCVFEHYNSVSMLTTGEKLSLAMAGREETALYEQNILDEFYAGSTSPLPHERQNNLDTFVKSQTKRVAFNAMLAQAYIITLYQEIPLLKTHATEDLLKDFQSLDLTEKKTAASLNADNLHEFLQRMAFTEGITAPLVSEAEASTSDPSDAPELRQKLQQLKISFSWFSQLFRSEHIKVENILQTVKSVSQQFETNAIRVPLWDEEPEQTKRRVQSEILKSLSLKATCLLTLDDSSPADPMLLLTIAAYGQLRLWELWADSTKELSEQACVVEKALDMWITHTAKGRSISKNRDNSDGDMMEDENMDIDI